MVITPQPKIRPARGTSQALVLDDRSVLEKVTLFPLMLEAIVGAPPDALELFDFALTVTRTTAGAIALILGTLRFGTKIRDIGKRTVPTVLAVKDQ